MGVQAHRLKSDLQDRDALAVRVLDTSARLTVNRCRCRLPAAIDSTGQAEGRRDGSTPTLQPAGALYSRSLSAVRLFGIVDGRAAALTEDPTY